MTIAGLGDAVWSIGTMVWWLPHSDSVGVFRIALQGTGGAEPRINMLADAGACMPLANTTFVSDTEYDMIMSAADIRMPSGLKAPPEVFHRNDQN